MKKLLFTLEYPPQIGGVANYYYNLVKSWPNENDIMVLDTSVSKNYNKLSFPHWFKKAVNLNKFISNNKIGHVIVGQILPLGPITYLASFLSNFKYSIVFHGLDYCQSQAIKRKKFISHLVLRRAENIFCANSYLAKSISNDYPDLAKKIKIVNPCFEMPKLDLIDENKLKAKYSLENKNIIFSVSRLVYRKGFDLVLKALLILKEKNKELFENTVYVLAGKGEELNNLKKIVRDNNLNDNVLFIEDIDEVEKFSFYNISNFFCMPSRNVNGDYEGFGIVYLEANYFKKPVIAALSGGVADAVVDNCSGLLIKENDVKGLYKAIEKLLTNKDLAKKLGEKAYQRLKNDFNCKNQASRFALSIKKP